MAQVQHISFGMASRQHGVVFAFVDCHAFQCQTSFEDGVPWLGLILISVTMVGAWFFVPFGIVALTWLVLAGVCMLGMLVPSDALSHVMDATLATLAFGAVPWAMFILAMVETHVNSNEAKKQREFSRHYRKVRGSRGKVYHSPVIVGGYYRGANVDQRYNEGFINNGNMDVDIDEMHVHNQDELC